MEHLSEDTAIKASGFSFAYAQAPASAAPASTDGEARAEEAAGEGICADAVIGPLDWQVPAGAFHLLVGATGSGKTTLLRNLSPVLAPTGRRAGAMEVLGKPLSEIDAQQAVRLIGYVAQSPDTQIVCDTVWHELAFGLENLGTAQDEMHRRIAELAHYFGIEPWFHRETASLSDGQRQTVALASVMAFRPRLLLLDEPTAQLDPVSARNFLHMLFRINRELGITVVVATHAPETMAEYATDAAQIADGRVRHVDLGMFAPRPPDGIMAFLLTGAGSAAASDSSEGRALDGQTRAPADSAAAPDEPPAITVHDAYVRYRRADDWVLRGCDYAVLRGQVSALVGGNGSGKSTLLRVIAGAHKTERGRVRNRLARRQALLPQDPKALFACDTVAEELREWQSSCGYGDDALEDATRRFALDDALDRHPYDLSGGQQQLLALAKLLLTDPDLMLLDEPTKGLDAASQLTVARLIDELSSAGVTIVIATHDLTFAALVADEASMLFDGEVTCTEPVDAFFEGNLFYRPEENLFARTRMQQLSGEAGR